MIIIEDLLHDIFNHLSFKETQQCRLLDQYFRNFIDDRLILDTIVWINYGQKQLPIKFLKKHKLVKLVIGIREQVDKNDGGGYIVHSDNMTDRIIQDLKGIQVLNLRGNCCITDKGLSYLSGIQKLRLGSRAYITDIGLSFLSGIKKLDLSSNVHITDKGLSYLSGIEHLRITESKQITDKGIAYIKGIKKLNLWRSDKITGKCLEYLSDSVKLYLLRIVNVFDDDLIHLTNVKDLGINAEQLTVESLKYLNNVKKIMLNKNPTLRNVACDELKNVDVLFPMCSISLGYFEW